MKEDEKPQKRTRRKKNPETKPLMVEHEAKAAHSTSTRQRANRSAYIERTNVYKNIDDGIIPFRNQNYQNRSSLDIKDAVILCQKAYYNFAVFRNTIDLMTEFSIGNIFLRGGNKKSRDFIEAFLRKIDIDAIQDKFYREYFRSGNVFVYRFDGVIEGDEARKLSSLAAVNDKFRIPVRYVMLNPSDIQINGTLTYTTPNYKKVLTPFEVERLRHPKTEEDKQMYKALDPQTKELVNSKNLGTSDISVAIPIDLDRLYAIFYKKQDYEPFAIPMGFPVLEDLNWKKEMKKMDMAITRTVSQAVLLITMGDEPDKGGVNQQNLVNMQELFRNESVGRVLIADYTTKAEFIVPKIADLLDPKKYEIVDKDILIGLNNILFGSEKYSNQMTKMEVFLKRLERAQQEFLSGFLIPEIKRLCKELGFRSYPTPIFDSIHLGEGAVTSRIFSRLVEIGVLTPEQGFEAIQSGRLPDGKESVDAQRKFKELRDEGLYQPLIGGGGITGRPEGTEETPQSTKEVSPIGKGENPNQKTVQKEAAAKNGISVSKIKEYMILAQKLESKVDGLLKRKHKIKELDDKQKEIAGFISTLVMCNETPKNWIAKAKDYVKEPCDKNQGRVDNVSEVALEHELNDYLAAIVFASKVSGDVKK